ncbi:MAG TPA: TonB-dependent receptor [Bryobacteraceae bacterium]|nr:TonB-dependent receptor [Bryobacteraceae bacterium]
MNKTFRAMRLPLALAAAVLLASMLFSQAMDSIVVGTVKDTSGAILAGAVVTATNRNTGVKYTTTSNQDGDYRLNNVPVGSYNVSATSPGFATATVEDVQLELNHTANVNLTLNVGSVSSTVEVTAAAAMIDTSTAQLQTTFNTKDAEDLGIAANSKVVNGSGIWNLSLLGAGVASSGGVGQGTGPSIAGQRPENNTFNVDGVVNDNHYVTGPQVTIPNDAVAEFTLLQNQFSPEFGGASGGVFNVLVKSGTNSVHGSVYEYMQNRDLNALDQQQRQAGLTSQPRYDNNRLGGTVGGPIIKDKLFYFGLYEYNPIGQASVPAGTVYAPTSAGLSALGNLPGVSSTNLGVFKQYVPTAGSQSGTISVGGQNIPIGPLTFASPNYFNSYNAVVAIDYNMSSKDQIRGRYYYNNSQGLDNVANLPVFFEPLPNLNKSVSVSEFHNFSATLENELRASYSRNNQNITAGNFKFPGLDAFPNLSIDDLNLQIGPDPNTPSGSIENLSTLQDNVTKSWGRHTFKFGYSATDVILAGFFVQRARGDYDYATLEQYLLDQMPTGGNISGVSGERTTGNANVPFGFFQQASYFNDDFRVKQNLTLNLGVRYEFVQVPVGTRYQAASALADVPGVITFREPNTGKNDWSPRVGFAWSPGSSQKWSVRGGFARSFDNTYINLNQNASPPFFATTLDCPAECVATGFLAGGGLKSTGSGGGWTTVEDARAAVASYAFDQTKRPYALTGTIGVQRLLGNDYTVEARYVYTKGVHLWNQTRLNILSRVSPTDFLPTYLSMPSADTIAGLKTFLGHPADPANNIPATGLYANTSNYLAQYGFPNNITGYHPWGNSRYNGLALQMNKRYSHNFQYIAAFTWSHAQDDSTATNFSTILSPRRAQDFQNLRAEWANSALDRRYRFTFTPLYDIRPFEGSSNWFLKNIVGNWNFGMTYTYQSPEYATVQSGVDSNLNGDSAGDRAIINPAGSANIGSGVTAIKNGNGDIVGYLANNPNARYIVAGKGARSNGGRNTLPFDPENNIDASLYKKINITERFAFQFGAQAFNLFNHPQFTGGYLSDVSPYSTAAVPRNPLIPSNADFGKYDLYFPSNSRGMQLVAKFTF